jgi:GDPmannose 4,6-dehydratase
VKRALITGAAGQDGYWLAKLLLEKEYDVHGIVRRSSNPVVARVATMPITLHVADMTDQHSLDMVISQVDPQEVYNLAAQSHVGLSFEIPEYTADVTGLGALRLLMACRKHAPQARFYQASTSELFGSAPGPQNEATPFHPRSPYGVAKAFAYYSVQNYREAYGMFAVNGILFNHESEHRGTEFVSRKITMAAARIKAGSHTKLRLGNLDAMRDWGHAEDYVRAMWMMLQQDKPQDYVIGTGVSHTVRDFLDAAFGELRLPWEGYVEIVPELYRPAEVNMLCADWSRARLELGWEPQISFRELVKRMISHDVRLVLDSRRAVRP